MDRVPSEANGLSTPNIDDGRSHDRLHVDSPAEWANLLRLTGGFHDAVVRHISVTGEEYLDHDYHLKMTSARGANAALLIHIQRRDVPAVELRFSGVEQLVFATTEQVDPARCTDAVNGMMRFELASVVLIARSCEVQVLGAEALGAAARATLPPD
jgi:hypothetical protein